MVSAIWWWWWYIFWLHETRGPAFVGRDLCRIVLDNPSVDINPISRPAGCASSSYAPTSVGRGFGHPSPSASSSWCHTPGGNNGSHTARRNTSTCPAELAYLVHRDRVSVLGGSMSAGTGKKDVSQCGLAAAVAVAHVAADRESRAGAGVRIGRLAAGCPWFVNGSAYAC